MVGYRYSLRVEKEENIAKAVGLSLPISTKQSIEICSAIRRKKLQRAKDILGDAIAKKNAIQMKRFNSDTGHKGGQNKGPGRYPVNACKEVLSLLESAEANARFKGINAENLVITHINAQKSSQQWHYGRFRRRRMKRTTVEIILKEGTKKKDGKAEKKAAGTEENGREKKIVAKEATGKPAEVIVKSEGKKTEEKAKNQEGEKKE